MDLARYFGRIGFHGRPLADLATLGELHRLHTEHIPFEGLSPFLGEPVPVDVESVAAKLVDQGRGGYCFEQNTLFAAVLQALGFRVTAHTARVRWNLPDEPITPRSHMVLVVEVPGGPECFADVGFGGMTLTGPLEMETGRVQSTPHEDFRIEAEGDLLRVEARMPQGWRPLYAFDRQPQLPVDIEVANHYSATYPRSRFVNHLVAARTEPGLRHVLLDDAFATHALGGPTRRETLAGPDAIVDVLREVFRIRIADPRALRDKLRGQ